jgi:hypothetical protein
MKIALATCFNIPEPDIDEALMLESFDRRGHEVYPAAWEDSTIDWSDFDAVIVRSTWNYPLDADGFADWIRRVDGETTLLNPASVMLGNLNKRYLIGLAERGVPTTPTHWIFPTEAASLREVMPVKSVIKPVIGCGSMDTRVFEANQVDEAIEWLSRQAKDREFMVQPFYNSVNTVGEQSIIVIAGEPTHRIIKHPRFSGQDERVDGPFEVDEYGRIVQMIIEPIREELLYARVDLMIDDEGLWRLSELELVEPSLFFIYRPSALEAMIDRVESLLA